MRLYISAKTSIKNVYIDTLEVVLTDGSLMVIDCDETFYDRNPDEESLSVEMRGIFRFDEESFYLNGHGKLLLSCTFKECQLYSDIGISHSDYFSIEDIWVEDNNERYEIDKECFSELLVCDENGRRIRQQKALELQWEFTTQEEMRFMYKQPENSTVGKCLIGIARGDFGRRGNDFYHTWFEAHTELKTQEFEEMLKTVIDFFRNDEEAGCLRNYKSMVEFCHKCKSNFEDSTVHKDNRGIKVKIRDYSFYLRLNPHINDYHFYCYCYQSKNQEDTENDY